MIRFLITVFFVTIFHLLAYALELLMVNNKHCIYCKKFLKEVASTYKIQSLPLRIISDFVAAWNKVMNLDRFDLK